MMILIQKMKFLNTIKIEWMLKQQNNKLKKQRIIYYSNMILMRRNSILLMGNKNSQKRRTKDNNIMMKMMLHLLMVNLLSEKMLGKEWDQQKWLIKMNKNKCKQNLLRKFINLMKMLYIKLNNQVQATRLLEQKEI